MPHCFAYGCTNHSGKLPSAVSMHSFPKELPLAETWVHHSRTDVGDVQEFVRNTLLKNPGHFVLCSEHFEEDMFEMNGDSPLIPSGPNHKRTRQKLKANAVPTLFSTGAPKLRRQAAQHLKIHERKQLLDNLLEQQKRPRLEEEETTGPSTSQDSAEQEEDDPVNERPRKLQLWRRQLLPLKSQFLKDSFSPVPRALQRKTPATLNRIAVYFSDEEWEMLEEWQRELYKNMMKENYEALISLGYPTVNPNILMKIKQEEIMRYTDQCPPDDLEQPDSPMADYTNEEEEDVLSRLKYDKDHYVKVDLQSQGEVKGYLNSWMQNYEVSFRRKINTDQQGYARSKNCKYLYCLHCFLFGTPITREEDQEKKDREKKMNKLKEVFRVIFIDDLSSGWVINVGSPGVRHPAPPTISCLKRRRAPIQVYGNEPSC